MKPRVFRLMYAAMLSLLIASLYFGFSDLATRAAQTAPAVPTGKPEATINLATDEGAKLVKGQWRYSDTRIVEVDFKSPGAGQQPTGAPNKTYDYLPKAGPPISTTQCGRRFRRVRWTRVVRPAGCVSIGIA